MELGSQKAKLDHNVTTVIWGGWYIVQFDKVTVSSTKHYLPSLEGRLSFKDITGDRKDGRISFMIKQNTNSYHFVKSALNLIYRRVY